MSVTLDDLVHTLQARVAVLEKQARTFEAKNVENETHRLLSNIQGAIEVNTKTMFRISEIVVNAIKASHEVVMSPVPKAEVEKTVAGLQATLADDRLKLYPFLTMAEASAYDYYFRRTTHYHVDTVIGLHIVRMPGGETFCTAASAKLAHHIVRVMNEYEEQREELIRRNRINTPE